MNAPDLRKKNKVILYIFMNSLTVQKNCIVYIAIKIAAKCCENVERTYLLIGTFY